VVPSVWRRRTWAAGMQGCCCVWPVYGDDVPEQLECRDVACPVYGEEEQPRRRFTYVVDGEVGRHRRRHRQVEYIVCVSQHRTWHQSTMIDNSHNINIYLSTLSADNSSQVTLTFNNNSSKHRISGWSASGCKRTRFLHLWLLANSIVPALPSS